MTRLFRRLMAIDDFRRMFLDRAAVYMGDFLNERGIRAIWDPMVDMIRQGNSGIVEDVSLFSVIMNDLNAKRLLKVPSLSELHKVGLSINKTINKMTTQLGDEFLEFIKDNSENK